LFESPPLAEHAPGLVAATTHWVNAVRRGSLDPEHARKLINREAEKYQTPHVPGEAPVRKP